jgi:predicted metalloprotease with PDZ domain
VVKLSLGWRVARSVWLLLLSFPAFASTLTCEISSIAPTERTCKIRCTASGFPPTGKLEFRFLDRFAGIERLSERIFGLRVNDATGQRLIPEVRGNGSYHIATEQAAQITFEYELRLAQLAGASVDPGRYALTSSLSAQAGFILLADALPEVCAASQSTCERSSVRLKFQLPNEWQVATTEPEAAGVFTVADARRAVFFLGKLQMQTRQVGEMKLQLAVVGQPSWPVAEIASVVEAIARQQATWIGSREAGNYLVTLAPFPVPLTGLRSVALTRGCSIVMMLNPEADAERTRALYQKHLTHEMFHFYVPEAMQPRENFDWFWEGFTRYVALLTLRELRLLSLRAYLDELGGEFAGYAANPWRGRISLLAVSQEKFVSAASYDLLYRKGTLVAALYDLELRLQSEGQRTVLDVMRALYANYRQHDLGNQEVVAALKTAGKFDSFVRDYLEGTREIELAEAVKPFGLTVENISGRLRLNVAKKLSRPQKAVWATLGQ